MLAHTYYLRDPRVRREAEALAATGLEVHVICLSEARNARGEREPRQAIVNDVHIHRLPALKPGFSERQNVLDHRPHIAVPRRGKKSDRIDAEGHAVAT